METDTLGRQAVADWTDALDRMDAELAPTLAACCEPERSATPLPDFSAALEPVAERLATWQESVARTEVAIRAAAEEFAADAAAVEAWQHALASARRTLAEAVAGAV